MSKTHWKKLHNPDYLGAYSLDNGNGQYIDVVATIKNVKVEPVVGPDGKKEECTVMRFVENMKPMVVNATNSKMMEKLFKTPYIEDWSGRKIQIGVESVKAFGDVVDALRIRKFLPREAEQPKCRDCSSEIVGAGEMNAAQVLAYSQRRFGCPLCAGCMKKRKEQAEAEQVPDPEQLDEPTEGEGDADGNTDDE